MQRALLVAVVLSGILVTATAHAAEFSGSVDKIADGDTFWVCDAAACHKIRLCGADAPEKGEPRYQESAEALRRLVEGQIVRCLQVATERLVTGVLNQRTTTGSLPSASWTGLT